MRKANLAIYVFVFTVAILRSVTLCHAVDETTLEKLAQSTNIAFLVEQFDRSEFSYKRAIYLRLKQLTGDDATPLAQVVKDKKNQSRTAAFLLAALGSQQSKELLVALLTDGDANTRSYAELAGGSIHEQDFLDHVSGLFADGREPVRQSAGQLLVNAGYASTDSLERILKKNDNPEIRSRVIQTLAKVHQPRTSEWVGMMSVLRNGVEVTGDLQWSRSEFDSLQEERRIDAILVKSLKKNVPLVKFCVMDALAERNNPDTIPELLKLLGTGDEYFQFRLGGALAKFGPESIDLLLAALLERNGKEQRVLADALMQSTTPWESTKFIPLLHHKDELIRRTGSELLARAVIRSYYSDNRPICLIVALLRNEKTYTRDAAQASLVGIGWRAIECLTAELAKIEPKEQGAFIATLNAIIDRESAEHIKVTERRALTERNFNASLPFSTKTLPTAFRERLIGNLEKALSHKNATVRTQVARALGATGDPGVIPVLIRLFSDDNADVRHRASDTLRSFTYQALPALQRAMSDPNPQVRLSALEAMDFLCKKGDISPFLTALKDRDRNVRLVLVDNLFKDGSDPAISALLELLSDTDNDGFFRDVVVGHLKGLGQRSEESLKQALADPKLMSGAALALGRLKKTEAIAPLLEICEKDPSLKVAALMVLENFPSDQRVADQFGKALNDPLINVRSVAIKFFQKYPPQIEVLAGALTSNYAELNYFAISELGKTDSPRKVDLLVSALKNTDYKINEAAAKELRVIADPRLESLLLALLDDERRYTKDFAMKLMAEKYGASPQVFTALKNAALIHDTNVAMDARNAILRLKSKEAADFLYSQWQQEIIQIGFGGYAAKEFIQLLWELKDDRALEVTEKAFSNRQSFTACPAAMAIDAAKVDDVRLIPLLISKLNTNACVSDVAKKSLIRIGSPAVEPLIASLSTEDGNMRREIVVILGNIGDIRALEPLSQLLNNENQWLRFYAVIGLGAMQNIKTQPLLVSALRDQYPAVRSEAATALGTLKDKAAIPSLIVVLDDNEPEVQRATMSSLDRITGNNFYPNADKWKEWWRNSPDNQH